MPENRDGILRIALDLMPDGSIVMDDMAQHMLAVWCRMRGRRLQMDLAMADVHGTAPVVLRPGGFRIFVGT